jgi:hypothetical protein
MGDEPLRPGCCPECSGSWAMGTCAELFDALLALDHSRRPPWGAHHGVSVATYLLQHPSRSTPAMRRGQWELVRAFTRDGLAAAQALAAARVAGNRGGRRPSDEPAAGVELDRVPAGFAVTIADVSVDGTFPADGFADRVASWARATVEAWTGSGGR